MKDINDDIKSSLDIPEERWKTRQNGKQGNRKYPNQKHTVQNLLKNTEESIIDV